MFPVIQPQFLFIYFTIETCSNTDITIVEAHSSLLTADAHVEGSVISIGGAGRGIEPGPAVQQAAALLSKQRRTLSEQHRTLFNQRRVLSDQRRTLAAKFLYTK
jgi:hypothetical protein